MDPNYTPPAGFTKIAFSQAEFDTWLRQRRSPVKTVKTACGNYYVQGDKPIAIEIFDKAVHDVTFCIRHDLLR